MRRIQGANVDPDLHGPGKDGFKEGVDPTEVTENWLNDVQEELSNVVEGAGVALDTTLEGETGDNRHQVRKVMAGLVDQLAVSQTTRTLFQISTVVENMWWADNQWLGAAADGRVRWSDDGVTWGLTITPTVTDLNAVAIQTTGAKFRVAVGDGGYITVSQDRAVTFQDVLSPTGETLHGVFFDNDVFVAVGNAGAVVTSTDALNWFLKPAPTTEILRAITLFRPTRTWVAVGDNGTILTSQDLIIWSTTTLTLDGDGRLKAIIYRADGELLVAVGHRGAIATSTDAINWSTISLPVTGADGPFLDDVDFMGSGLIVAVGTWATASGGVLVSSHDDGKTWSIHRPPPSLWADVFFGCAVAKSDPATDPASGQMICSGSGESFYSSLRV